MLNYIYRSIINDNRQEINNSDKLLGEKYIVNY